MFLCAIQPYIVAVIIAVIVAQYAFALFCLLKLAYLDIDKKQYVLWNLLILLVFFIGGGVFLWYYYKHPDLRIQKLARDELPVEQLDENCEKSVDDRAEDRAQADVIDAESHDNADCADKGSDGE